MKTKKTTHTPKCATIKECQSSYSPASTTAKLAHTLMYSKLESKKDGGFLSASNADPLKLKKTGKKSNPKQSPLTAGDASAVPNRTPSSLQSITPPEMARSKERKDCEDGGFTAGSENADIRKTDIDFSAGTATVREANTASARTLENNARLISAAPELLAALILAEKFMAASTKYSEPGEVLIATRAAIAKAEGDA